MVIASILAAMLSIGVAILTIGVFIALIQERQWFLVALFTFLGVPIAFLFAVTPWALIANARSPDLVTLKKSTWECVEYHRVGKSTQCYLYGRKAGGA